MKIDVYSHVAPKKYVDAFHKLSAKKPGEKALSWQMSRLEFNRALWDMDVRLQVVEKYDDLTQVLTPTGPALELFAQPDEAIELARIYNDEAAELVAKYPDRFVAAVALLPLNDIEATLAETRRAITELGFKGVMINSPLYGNDVSVTKPIDLPELMPFYEMMSAYDLPIWIHPRREASMADYTVEDKSKYYIFHCFGWPYDTSAAMTRLVFSGVLEKYPNLKIVTHHCGAMVPYLVDRIDKLCGYQESFGSFTQEQPWEKLSQPVIEYFKKFYNDTGLYGNAAGLMCAYAFFGAEHILFGTDMPYATLLGDQCTADTIKSVEQMGIPAAEKELIFQGNARKLLHLDGAKTG
ncbi:amidohydrolase family protein [Chloroflexota bacterium]